MLKKIATSLFGTRHAREMKRVQPIVDAINAEYERLHSISEEELRAQTAKLRGIIAERARPLEEKIAALRERKHSTPDAEERDRIDREINGPDGKGGLEARAARRDRRNARRNSPRGVRHRARRRATPGRHDRRW